MFSKRSARPTIGVPEAGGFPGTPTWCVDDVITVNGHVEIRGWYVRPEDQVFSVQVNGTMSAVEEHARADLDAMIVAGPHNLATGFSASIEQTMSNGLELCPVVDEQPMRTMTYWYPADDLIGPLPPSESRTRVHGGDSLPSFLLEGYTSFRQLSAVIDSRVRLRRRQPVRILDWGCGCGRVTRYFGQHERYTTVGVDIDQQNVGWCRTNLPGQFETISPLPPIELPDESFDVIVGVSVMTHLDDNLQGIWLHELARLLVPDGVALLTTHGWATARRSGLPDEFIEKLERDGYVDGGVNPNIPDTVVEHGYYRNVFNSPAYIRRHWHTNLTVESIVAGAIGQHQDLVILRKSR